MEIKIWWIWMIIAAFFIVGEIFTQGFFILWFGVGAAVAGILSLLGLGIGWQLAAFVVVSGVLFIVSRRFAERFSKKQPPGIGADRFVGLEGIVLEEIDNAKNTGQVRVQKDEWRADSETGEIIPVGKRVKVTRLDGTHLVVKITKEEE
ncbi:MAG: NfeD family protein [Candidatus Aminicenantes bacterium]|nr:NfeD family protein [Candidatus Aminicenantes bacterium]MDH5744550.1 NfeD family protein [Candidatus Aminicenantes bacterium]